MALTREQLAEIGQTLNAYASRDVGQTELGGFSPSPPSHETERSALQAFKANPLLQQAREQWKAIGRADERIGLERYDRGQVEEYSR